MTDHPLTPPPELVEQWVQATESNDCIGAFPTNFEKRICIAAARWGADQELEACCEWFKKEGWNSCHPEALVASRRPKPPSLKEQALEALDRMWTGGSTKGDWELFRRALEALPDD
jgi:hypothetical protein